MLYPNKDSLRATNSMFVFIGRILGMENHPFFANTDNTVSKYSSYSQSGDLTIYFLEKIDLNALSEIITVIAKENNVDLKIVGFKVRESEKKLEIFVDVSGESNTQNLKEEIYQRYNTKTQKSPENGTANYIFIETLIQRNQKNILGSNSQIHGEDYKVFQGDITMTSDRTINTDGGNYNERIQGDYVQGNYYAAGQPQSLTQASAEIQELLKQLEQTYPTTTTSQQMVVAAEAIKQIESNPSLKKRAKNAVKEGGLAAFEKAIDNPAGAFIVGAIKGWQEVEED